MSRWIAATSRWFVTLWIAIVTILNCNDRSSIGVFAAVTEMREVAGCWRTLTNDGGSLMPNGAEWEFTVSGNSVSQCRVARFTDTTRTAVDSTFTLNPTSSSLSQMVLPVTLGGVSSTFTVTINNGNSMDYSRTPAARTGTFVRYTGSSLMCNLPNPNPTPTPKPTPPPATPSPTPPPATPSPTPPPATPSPTPPPVTPAPTPFPTPVPPTPAPTPSPTPRPPTPAPPTPVPPTPVPPTPAPTPVPPTPVPLTPKPPTPAPTPKPPTPAPPTPKPPTPAPLTPQPPTPAPLTPQPPTPQPPTPQPQTPQPPTPQPQTPDPPTPKPPTPQPATTTTSPPTTPAPNPADTSSTASTTSQAQTPTPSTGTFGPDTPCTEFSGPRCDECVSFTQRPCQFCNGQCLDAILLCDEDIKVPPNGTCPLPSTTESPLTGNSTTDTDAVTVDSTVDDNDLGIWPWVGLGIGLCVLLLIIIIVVAVLVRRRKRNASEDATPPPPSADATQSFFDDIAVEEAYVPKTASAVHPTSEYASAAGLADLPPPSASSVVQPVIYSSMANMPKETGPIVYESFS